MSAAPVPADESAQLAIIGRTLFTMGAENPSALREYLASLTEAERAKHAEAIAYRTREIDMGVEAAAEWRATPATMANHLTGGRYRLWPYTRLLGEKYRDAVEGRSTRQIWALPARYGKSQTASRWGPAWALDRDPSHKIILVSYGDNLAVENAIAVRDIMREHSDVLRATLQRDRQRQDRFVTTEGGGVLAAGVMSAITGFGAHGVCFTAGTRISTPNGPVPIEKLSHSGGRIWAYDHRIDSVVEARVSKGWRRQADDLIEVSFRSGGRFVCTPDHLIYTARDGYVPARLVEVGTQVFKLGEPGVPGMRGHLPTPRLRLREVGASGRSELLLLPPMSSRSSAAVRGLSAVRTIDGEHERQALLPGVLGALAGEPATQTARHPMPYMRDLLSSDQLASAVLLPPVCKCGSFTENAGEGELPLQGCEQLHGAVLQNAAVDSRTRQPCVHRVWEVNRADSRPSLQRNTAGQSPREPRGAVPSLPHDAPQVGRDTVSMVRRIRRAGEYVYDLTVEGLSNFFADGVLVHNCFDDPFKDWQEAHSQARRDLVDNQFRAVVSLRLETEAAWVIIVATRWHENDLSGRLLARMQDGTGEQWEMIRLPAVAEAFDPNSPDPLLRIPDPLGRKPGEVLEPERFSPAAVAARHLALGSYLTAGLEQQRPAPEEGGELKRSWWRLDDNVPADADEWLISADMKLKEKETGDFVVVQTWARTGSSFWLTAQLRGQWNQPTTECAIALASVRQSRCRTAVVENTGNGPEVMQSLREPMADYVVSDEVAGLLGMTEEERAAVQRLRRRGMTALVPENVKGSKVVRARAVSGLIEAGNVHLWARAPWLGTFLDEASSFPNGAHDDQVDAMSQALKRLRGSQVSVRIPDRPVVKPPIIRRGPSSSRVVMPSRLR